MAASQWYLDCPETPTAQSHKPAQFKQTGLGSLMVNGSTLWLMYPGVMHLDTETRAAELHWSFLFLVNLAPLKRQPWELYQYNRWGVSLGMLASRLWGCIGLRMRTSENLALVCQHRALFACGPHGVSDCRKFVWRHHLSAMSSLFVLGTSRQILSLLQTLLPDRVLWRFVRSTYSVERQKAKTLGLEVKLHY